MFHTFSVRGKSAMPGRPQPCEAGAFSYARGVRVPEILDVHAVLTATEAARYAGVSVQAVGNWHKRGYCLPDGTRVKLPAATDGHGREIRDACGRPKYRLLDVAKAEAATSKRARRAA